MNRVNKVGFIGLGKLGLPCASAMSVKGGVEVIGYDIDTRINSYVESKSVPYVESGIEENLKDSNIRIVDSVHEVLIQTDLIFCAIQTPHEEKYEGNTPAPKEKMDFDYGWLISCSKSIAESLKEIDKTVTLVIISTVLPGTMRKYLLPIFDEVKNKIRFCYNPFFIAMGTTIHDFLNPEFILIGRDSPNDSKELVRFYNSFIDSPIKEMEIESAELTKVAYNTFIGFKIVFANVIAEICSVRGGNPDEVTQALGSAKDRLMSGKYLSAGMADGGGCHPRDQIAMSHLAEELRLSADPFSWLAEARDMQTKRQAEIIRELHGKKPGLGIVILGEAYKANINLRIGSPSRLLQHFLREMNLQFEVYDPFVYPNKEFPTDSKLFFVATNHNCFRSLVLPELSIVIDPWKEGIDYSIQPSSLEIFRIGRNNIHTQ